MKKRFTRTFFLLLVPLLFAGNILSAQDTVAVTSPKKARKPDSFWRRVSLGGYLSAQFGSVAGVIISPEAKVRIVDHLYGGLGFTYEYNYFKNYYYDTKTNETLSFKLNVYGGRVFARYYLASLFDNFLGNIFAHVEYEYLYYISPYRYDPNGSIVGPDLVTTFSRGKTATEVNSFFVGGGYSQPLGGRASLDLLILFNLNDSYNSPYSNPIFRIGFGVGL
jgi:hypothetical protein